MNSKNTKRALLSSVVAMLVCFTMLLSTTFAWFTDTAVSGSNVIVSGKLDIELVDANGDSLEGQMIEWAAKDGRAQDEILWEPGCTYETEEFYIVNNGNLKLKFQFAVSGIDGNAKLLEVIDFTVKADASQFKFNTGAISVATSGEFDLLKGYDLDTIFYGVQHFDEYVLEPGDKVGPLVIKGHMDETADNDYQGLTIDGIAVSLVATQATGEEDSFNGVYDENAEYPVQVDTWDGTADTSWYDPANPQTEYSLSTAEQLAGLAKLVDAGETFEGKTVKLGNDIDLANILFEPIGSYRKDLAFKGTFDGQGHTISNMSQNTWELDNGYYYGDLGLGLFGKVEDAVIKNLTVDAASVSGESAICGAVAATAYGECKFENIKVTNSKVNDYQYYAGGIVGWASGDHQYVGCNVDASTTIGGQWGDFGNANGGIIGGAGTSGTYHFEDCTVACRIDAVNDVVSAYQWYNYRNSGMLIGKVGPAEIVEECTNVTANNVTCKNVNVIFGDWANYTYCEFAGTGYPYVRVQAGVSVDAYSNVRYGHPTDANGNTVVDDNHVHNDGEAHHKLIAFDNLFGGPANDRYCYYGISEFDGVNVVYNNK